MYQNGTSGIALDIPNHSATPGCHGDHGIPGFSGRHQSNCNPDMMSPVESHHSASTTSTLKQ